MKRRGKKENGGDGFHPRNGIDFFGLFFILLNFFYFKKLAFWGFQSLKNLPVQTSGQNRTPGTKFEMKNQIAINCGLKKTLTTKREAKKMLFETK